MRKLTIFSGSALMLASGCIETDLISQGDPINPLDDQAAPCIVVTPPTVTFDAINVAQDPAQTVVVTVTNDCGPDVETGDLEIKRMDLLDAGMPFILGSLGSVLVPAGSSSDFTVTFDPQTSQH